MAAMNDSLAARRRRHGVVYLAFDPRQQLPFALKFDDVSFDLALSSHFLFLYTAQLGEAFHRAAVREMCRVASEIRIFPLLMLGGQRSPCVDQQVAELRQMGMGVSIEAVDYEFQRGGSEMMRIRQS